ncbi:MAG: glutamine amidotransferase family protein [Pseudomonadota bacterium]
MCGIVGLFLKDPGLEPELGRLLSEMLATMTDRGPDSAGVAIYPGEVAGRAKLTVQSSRPDEDFAALEAALSKKVPNGVEVSQRATHAVISVARAELSDLRSNLAHEHPDFREMSYGDSIEIYKEVGLPQTVADQFDIAEMAGSHGIGHTRMATESAVTTLGAHPFNTGPDQCLVHNGSLSNHNAVRRKLLREGIRIQTENDTEVGAAYLTWRMQSGATLGEALETAIDDLDGFYTFVVGTKDGFGVLRDPIACKPAVLAETEAYVAFGSEYRALVGLPGIETARVWEPEPATVYFWSHTPAPSAKAA